MVWSVTGCQWGYYLHLAQGQRELSRRAKPLEWWETHATDETLLLRLQQVRATLTFARQNMAMDVGRLYGRYVELDRPQVMWGLVATPPFDFTPWQWCYPLIGCAPYRGFFDWARLQRERARLEAKGYEVHIFGIPAYSTLGWLKDPVTDLMLQGGPWENAELLLHELTHAHYYRKGDTVFNESLATAVARRGVSQWLALHGEQVLNDQQRRWQQQDAALQQVVALVQQARVALKELYAGDMPEAVLREQQQRIRQQLRDQFQIAREANPALDVYAGWFAQPLTNAQLNLMHFYQGQVSRFEALLDACDGDWQTFWQAVRALPTVEKNDD